MCNFALLVILAAALVACQGTGQGIHHANAVTVEELRSGKFKWPMDTRKRKSTDWEAISLGVEREMHFVNTSSLIDEDAANWLRKHQAFLFIWYADESAIKGKTSNARIYSAMVLHADIPLRKVIDEIADQGFLFGGPSEFEWYDGERAGAAGVAYKIKNVSGDKEIEGGELIVKSGDVLVYDHIPIILDLL